MRPGGNEYYEVVDRFKIPAERYRSGRIMSTGHGARQNRGRPLPPDKIEALIWGLYHENPVVRRCCLEALDAHPDRSAVPHILAKLEDPVPRVRWHAVHALLCDDCKAGQTHVSPEVIVRVREMAENDPSPKVRQQAAHRLERVTAD